MAKLRIGFDEQLDLEIRRGASLDVTLTLRDKTLAGTNKLASAAAVDATTITLASGRLPRPTAKFTFSDGDQESLIVDSVNGQVVTFTTPVESAHASNAAVTFSGPLQDLSVYTSAKAQWRASAEDDTVIDELTTTVDPPEPPEPAENRRSGAITLGGEAGTIRMHTPPSVLADYPDDSVYDVALYDDDGAAWYPFGGATTFVDGVTK